MRSVQQIYVVHFFFDRQGTYLYLLQLATLSVEANRKGKTFSFYVYFLSQIFRIIVTKYKLYG